MRLLLLGRADDRRDRDRLHTHGVALGPLLEVAGEPGEVAVARGSAAQAPAPAGHATPPRQPGVGLMGIAAQRAGPRHEAIDDHQGGDEPEQEADDPVEDEGHRGEREQDGQRPGPHPGRSDGPLHNICIPPRASSTGP